MDRLLVSTLPGFEALVEEEARSDFGLEGQLLAPGRVALTPDPGRGLAGTVRALNRWSRCADRVGILLLDADGADGLERIEELAAAVDYARLLAPEQTFAVRAARSGEHPFRSPDVARAVGTAVNRILRDRAGAPGRVDLDRPDVVVRADLQDRRLMLWLDTTGDDGLHVRSYRRHAHMASMRPTVANLLLRLSGWRGGPLVDPFCGSATILIEALLWSRGAAPGRHRGRPWAWQRLGWLARDADADADPRLAPVDPPAPVLGIERFARHLQGGIENAGLAGVADGLRLHEGRAEHTDRAAARLGVDLEGGTVVTNPPFGRRVGTVAILDRLYRESALAWARAGIARVAIVAEREATMRRGLGAAGYEIRRELPVIYGSTPVTAFLAVRS